MRQLLNHTSGWLGDDLQDLGRGDDALARYLLNVIQDAGHFVFFNECDQAGRDEIPKECIDPPGADRAAIHREIGDAALRFFGTALGT